MRSAHRKVGPQADRDGTEDGVLGLGLLLVVGYDVFEGDLAQLVDLADAVERAQDDLVQVAPVHHGRLVRDHVRHHRVHLSTHSHPRLSPFAAQLQAA